jgi:hypothetical protein
MAARAFCQLMCADDVIPAQPPGPWKETEYMYESKLALIRQACKMCGAAPECAVSW